MSTQTLLPAEIGVTFVPRLRDMVVAVPVKNESVLYEEDTGAVHQLDPIATLVCGMFDGERSIERVVGELTAAFGADRSVIETDVLGLTRDLGRRGLLMDVRGDARYAELDDVDHGC
jgi:hypothetical protein